MLYKKCRPQIILSRYKVAMRLLLALPDCTLQSIQSTSKWIWHQWLDSSCHRNSNWQKFSVFSKVLHNIDTVFRKKTHTQTSTTTSGQLTLALIGQQLCPLCIASSTQPKAITSIFHMPTINLDSTDLCHLPPANWFCLSSADDNSAATAVAAAIAIILYAIVLS